MDTQWMDLIHVLCMSLCLEVHLKTGWLAMFVFEYLIFFSVRSAICNRNIEMPIILSYILYIKGTLCSYVAYVDAVSTVKYF